MKDLLALYKPRSNCSVNAFNVIDFFANFELTPAGAI